MVEKDVITIKEENGRLQQFEVEALFEMQNKSYALLSAEKETIVMKVVNNKDNQILVNVSEDERNNILNAYEIAIEADFEQS